MLNIQNKIAYFINFNKHNLLITYVLNKFYQKEYVVIHIIPIGTYLYIYTKTTLLITLLAKIYSNYFYHYINTNGE